MKHSMTLYAEPFKSIKSGVKTIEIRLNDEKRRSIRVGDKIEFFRLPDKKEMIEVIVEELIIFKTFEDMYRTIPFKDFGCDGWTMEDMIEGTYAIYTPEREETWGTLAIRIKRITD